MTDNIKFPPMPKAHTVVKPENSEPFGLITTRDALNFAAEAVRLNAQAVPDTREMFNAGWCAAARFCDREDAVYDGLVGPGGCPAFESAYRDAWTELSAAPQPAQPLTDEQAHGIGVKS